MLTLYSSSLLLLSPPSSFPSSLHFLPLGRSRESPQPGKLEALSQGPLGLLSQIHFPQGCWLHQQLRGGKTNSWQRMTGPWWAGETMQSQNECILPPVSCSTQTHTEYDIKYYGDGLFCGRAGRGNWWWFVYFAYFQLIHNELLLCLPFLNLNVDSMGHWHPFSKKKKRR